MCGDFTFDAEEFQRVRAEWEELQRQVAMAGERFRELDWTTSRAPAQDPATTAFLDKARAAVAAAQGSHAMMRSYVDGYLRLLERTAAGYTGEDAEAARRIDSAAPDAGTTA